MKAKKDRKGELLRKFGRFHLSLEQQIAVNSMATILFWVSASLGADLMAAASIVVMVYLLPFMAYNAFRYITGNGPTNKLKMKEVIK